MLIAWLSERRVPRNPKGKVGIAVAITREEDIPPAVNAIVRYRNCQTIVENM